MAVRLGEQVVCGEICNTSHYTVHGWIQLRGRKHPVLLQLTGDCDLDLAGRHIRFEARGAEKLEQEELEDDGAERPEDDLEQEDAFPFLATQQVGPTGTMTAARKVKVADCPASELYLRSKLGEPPPMEWKRCLYLEWFSQNGRVVVEMADPLIEFIESEEDAPGEPAADGSPSELPIRDIEAVLPSFDADGGQDELSAEEADGWDEDDLDDDFDEEDEDPYALFPEGLRERFESEASALDRTLEGGDEGSRAMHEMELMDELIESGPGVPLDETFEGPLRLPRPEQLGDDAEAETALKTLFAQLALFGIALDVCKHFTPRDAYRLLLEEICPEQTAYPELRSTQWVQHFMTSEFCPQCEAEFDREFEESERKRKENPGADAEAPEDDLPY